jgi:P-type Cu+ transporter
VERDPACGMAVDPRDAKHTSQRADKTYYFCAPGCKKAFEGDPEMFLDPTYKPSM